MLGTKALVVMRVPSSHCDAITAVAREPPREILLEGALPKNLGTLTAALGTLVPPAGWWHRVSCTTSGAAAPPLILTFAPSGQEWRLAKPTRDQLTRLPASRQCTG